MISVPFLGVAASNHLSPSVEVACLAISENRQADFAALTEQAFFDDTQLASDVLRRRIRHYREALGLSQAALAEEMTDLRMPLTHAKVSLIERGKRRVHYDELLAFAYVLRVPLATLMSPVDGERPIRAGGIGLERHEVANWIVWGDSKDATKAKLYMSLTRQIWTMAQVIEDERDPAAMAGHRKTLAGLIKELQRKSSVRPGVMERQAMRDEMASAHAEPT